jgi:hypothetical protein
MPNLRRLVPDARKLAVLAAVPVVALAIGASAFAARPPDNQKVSVCHLTGAGTFVQLSISERALAAHLRHGDVMMGDYGYCP